VSSFQHISDIFGLGAVDPSDQDWELTAADPNRIGDFLDGFPNIHDRMSQIILAELIMSSFDEAAMEGPICDEDWKRFWNILEQDIPKFLHIIEYWSKADGGDSWAIGYRLRETLAEKKFDHSLLEWHEDFGKASDG
jgi:hypothetical protein